MASARPIPTSGQEAPKAQLTTKPSIEMTKDPSGEEQASR